MKTTLFINGLALDKVLFKEILKKIENDNHLKFAIKYFMENAKAEKRNDFSTIIKEWFNIIAPASDIIVHGASHILEIYLDYIVKGVNKLAIPLNYSEINYNKYTSFDLFNLFFSHISDTQCITSFYNLKKPSKNNKIKHIYCDKPYFENKYIDSIDISFKKNHITCIESIVAIIYNHLNSILYSENIIKNINDISALTTHDNKAYLKVLLDKRAPYGIWLLSEILYRLYKDENIIFEFDKHLFNDKNCFKKDFKKENKEFAGIDGAFLRECLLLAGNPGKMEFVRAGDRELHSEKNLVRVEKINYETSQSQKNGFAKNLDFAKLSNLFYRGDHNGFVQMTIPIKTVISLPSHYYMQLVNESYPEVEDKLKKSFPLPGVNNIVTFDENSKDFKLKNRESLEFFFLGGGEHNNALVHLCNALRYANPHERNFGLIENSFDRALKLETERQYPHFLIGSENFVSGINAVFRGRETTDAPLPMAVEVFKNEAEVLKIELGKGKKLSGYALYGFSAPMTRLAFLSLIYALSRKRTSADNPLINFGTNKAKLYQCSDKLPSFWALLENEFDPGDIMNNSDNMELIKLLIDNMKGMPSP
jgi:hypothetical protein